MADRKKDYRKKTYSSSENIANAANEIGKVPPQARDLEEAVLGSMMIDQDSLDESVGTLNIDCFYDPRHKMVFEAISKLYNENKPVDILSVAERMREDGTLDKVGGAQFLAGLTSMIDSGAHIEYHSEILQQKAIQRSLISASYDILRDAFDETVNVDDLISSSQNKMYDAVSTTMKNTYKHVGDVVNRSLDIIAKVQSEGISPGLASGFSRMLKATAKELEIPIIALSQLNRNLASRAGSNGRPMLSDLRESGSIEQDADMVLFVHRPAALGLDPNADPAYTEIIIAKNRSGKIGTVELKYVGDQFRFEEPSNFDFAFGQNQKPQIVEQPQYNPFEGEIPKWPTPGDEWK